MENEIKGMARQFQVCNSYKEANIFLTKIGNDYIDKDVEEGMIYIFYWKVE